MQPDKFLAAVGKGLGVEYLAQIIVNSLFISKGHRDDVTLTLVLEGAEDFSRAISFCGADLGSLDEVSETALLQLLAQILARGAGLRKEQSVDYAPGIQVQAISFEHLVTSRLADPDIEQVYLLDKKGTDLRQNQLASEAVFLLTDHIPLPKKSHKSLVRKGVIPLSLGPLMLHASQCVVLIENEYDRN